MTILPFMPILSFMNEGLDLTVARMTHLEKEKEEVENFIQRTTPLIKHPEETNSIEIKFLNGEEEEKNEEKKDLALSLVFRNGNADMVGFSMFEYLDEDVGVITNFWDLSLLNRESLDKAITSIIHSLLCFGMELGFKSCFIETKCEEEINILINSFDFIATEIDMSDAGLKAFFKEDITVFKNYYE